MKDGAFDTFELSHGLAVASRVNGLDAKLVAILHDALEDGACTVPQLDGAHLPDRVVEAIKFLTRRPGETYEDYIAGLIQGQNPLAVRVKIADLETNLARMDYEHRRLSGRYQAALSALRGEA